MSARGGATISVAIICFINIYGHVLHMLVSIFNFESEVSLCSCMWRT